VGELFLSLINNKNIFKLNYITQTMLSLNTEKKIKGLGLNSYEVKIWTALLSRGVSTAGELSDIANVPRSRSYDVLESLEKKGFVAITQIHPTKYIAVTPREVIGVVKKKILQKAAEEISELVKMSKKHTLAELKTIHSHGMEQVGPTELSGVLQGRHNLQAHFEYMVGRAEKYILISAPVSDMVVIFRSHKQLFGKMKYKNIKIKVLTQLNKTTKKIVKEMGGLVEINNTNNKSSFVIVDGREMMFAVLDREKTHPAHDVGIWVNSPLAADMASLF